MKRTIAAFLGLLVLAAPVAAQIPERLDGALRAIYGQGEYTAESFGPVVWLDNGTRYATIGGAGVVA